MDRHLRADVGDAEPQSTGAAEAERHNGPATPRGRLRVRLSREGALYLAILVVLLASALVNEINLLVLLFGLMVGPFLFSGLLAWNALRGIEVRRRAPEHTEAGEPFSVILEAQDRKLLGGSWSITVEDHLEGPAHGVAPLERYAPRVWFMHLAGGRATRGAYRGTISQRGVYRFGTVKLSTRFPLGLIELGRTFDHPGRLVVYPRSGRLTRRWAQRLRSVPGGRGHRLARAAAGENDYHGLRDFRAGDNPRWIHWRTSARHGRLMVREFEQNHRQDVVVVLDLWAPEAASEHQRDLVELAVSVAATICADACRSGRHRLVVVLGGERVEAIQGRTSPAMLHHLLGELAGVRPRCEGDLRHVLQRTRWSQPGGLSNLAQARHDARRGVFVVSTRPPSGPERRQPVGSEGPSGNGTNGGGTRRYLFVGGPELSELYQCRESALRGASAGVVP